ncbi:LodA/GoxA family CTQ-dependent oxidase [Eleftheria terrae]|uniref:LodA/GoxA family CTQ-dependent oxidase n=1 Tax=Eleftheria terrae TaxID=1597781 RepID=UPI00263BBC03|nr:LodA/GoxA family CTQ-dependent oxidase [Eleftheria terrae]WKB50591.1 LodA/GoxA family CTQ-dependent oxidase [Eleftheria terrae]
MATVYRIHPAIGIARLGNSPDEFFIGPERPGAHPEPAGGFKDAQCRVKRQAARFRIYAHHDDNSVEEITDAQAEITWTVHLANRKAAFPGRGNNEPAADLVIDPGPRTLEGPNQIEPFDSGSIRFSGQQATTVPLGEIRSDDDNHLIVLGGLGRSASPGGNGIGSFWGNAGWYDDVSDGPVSATVKIRATGETPAVEGAWVIVAPPKFAPHQDSIVTLYDRVFQAMVDAGHASAPATTSYTRDVYPILQRARDTKWVYETFAHGWPDPVVSQPLREAIFNRLRPGGNMPALNGGDSALTAVQYAHMQRWKDGNFDNDWAGVPLPEAALDPDGLDRAALEAGVGGAFFPGIEAGGLDDSQRPIVTAANYQGFLRINAAAVAPGGITATMALPWQADFNACADNWWPVPRPNQVRPQSNAGYVEWDRGVGSYEDMVAKWHTLGFVVRQGSEHVEVDRCGEASITLLTPHLDFVDIPQGPMGMVREQPLAISFEVVSTAAAVTLEYAPGGAPAHPQLVAANTSVTVGPTAGSSVATARLWVVYRTGLAPSALPTQVVTVREPVSGQQWSVSIDGNTVARKTAAAALVLDRSGSMAEDRGDGTSKQVALQQAAGVFVDVMLEGDGVGIVRYNEDAQALQPVLALGGGGLSDLNRNQTVDLINGNQLDPQGATSIGDGIHEGRQILDAAGAGYDLKALVVLTDGKENRARYIADVAGEINERTYAVGLGTPQNTSAAALQTVSGNHGGFLLVTGAIDTDNRFLLQKYFLQILAGVSNAEVVLDPDGELRPGAVHRIPFVLSEADAGVDVILLTPYPQAIDFRLQTPNGLLLEPWRAASEPGMRFVAAHGVCYYRLVLPVQLVAGRYDQQGTWHALLRIGEPRHQPSEGSPDGADHGILQGLHSPQALQAGRRPPPALPGELGRAFSVAQASAAGATAAAAQAAAAGRRSLPYSLVVHSYSSVSLRGQARQDSHEPGAGVQLTATLTQSGLPLQGEASVWAELTRPDGSRTEVPLAMAEAGRYQGDFQAASPGVWRVRLRARGRTRKGLPFTREQQLTAAVWRGGDHDATGGAGGSLQDLLQERDERLCRLLRCLLTRGHVLDAELERRLHEAGIDLELARKCLASFCAEGRATRRGNQDG